MTPLSQTQPAKIGTTVLRAPSRELTDEQADWVIQRLEWAAGLHVGMAGMFAEAFGVGVEFGVRDEYREEAREAVRRIARLSR